MAHQELDFKFLLKLLDLEAKSRLSNVEGLRSFCKAAAIDNAREVEKLLKVHKPPRCNRRTSIRRTGVSLFDNRGVSKLSQRVRGVDIRSTGQDLGCDRRSQKRKPLRWLRRYDQPENC